MRNVGAKMEMEFNYRLCIANLVSKLQKKSAAAFWVPQRDENYKLTLFDRLLSGSQGLAGGRGETWHFLLWNLAS